MQNQAGNSGHEIHSPVAELLPDSQKNNRQMRKPLHRAILISIPLFAAFLGLFIGGVVGLSQYLQCQRGFESQVIFRVVSEDTSKSPKDEHHVERAGSKLIVEQCLSRDGGKLRNLKWFEDTPHDKIADQMKRNLVVEAKTDDGDVVVMKLITSFPNDSATLLNNLVATYENSVSRREEQSRRKEMERLASSKLKTDLLGSDSSKRTMFERLENAIPATKETVRGSLNLIWNPALIGTVIGLLVGVILAFVVK